MLLVQLASCCKVHLVLMSHNCILKPAVWNFNPFCPLATARWPGCMRMVWCKYNV